MTKITLLCTDIKHPLFPFLEEWVRKNTSIYEISLLNYIEEIKEGGDILFLISCSEIC